MSEPSGKVDLPTPPPGAWWEVHGTPTKPWIWSNEIVWHHDSQGRVIGINHLGFTATAGEATAELCWEGNLVL